MPGRRRDRHAPARRRASWRSTRATGRASIATRSRRATAAELAAWRRAPLEAWAPGGESLPEVAARVRPALATMLARLGEGRAPGTHDRPQVAGYADPVLEHPWSIVVGHDGVFKVALLTLFDLPLDRFWMWSMDLCGISVIEFRAGRPVLRAHNLTAHLAALTGRESALGGHSRNAAGAARSSDRRARRCAAQRRASSGGVPCGGRPAAAGRPGAGAAQPCRLASRSSPRISRA